MPGPKSSAQWIRGWWITAFIITGNKVGEILKNKAMIISEKCYREQSVIKKQTGNSLVVQWLRLCAFTAKGRGRGTKTPQATWCGQKNKQQQQNPPKNKQTKITTTYGSWREDLEALFWNISGTDTHSIKAVVIHMNSNRRCTTDLIVIQFLSLHQVGFFLNSLGHWRNIFSIRIQVWSKVSSQRLSLSSHLWVLTFFAFPEFHSK